MDFNLLLIIPLLVGWGADFLFGDPQQLPHPVVWFGKMIAAGEKQLNHGHQRRLKGGILAVTLIIAVFAATWAIDSLLSKFIVPSLIFKSIIVFYCLAGTTLVREVREVFRAADHSLQQGRRQVSRIVGRDTSQLTDREVRIAALETLAENLSDGVIAPLFWYAILGVPGMLTYKMVNTLDSMIGYRTQRYAQFGTIAARIDDVANWIPARLTALLMIAASGIKHWKELWNFVMRFGSEHASPNSGWPEAAMAGYLNCQFGGPHNYFGQTIDKPFIGTNSRNVTTTDLNRAICQCRCAEILMLAAIIVKGLINF